MTRRGANRGFTLIEIMIVIIIIGLLASQVVLNIGGESRQDRLNKELDGLQARIQLASELAMLKQVELGFHIDEKGYRFLVFENEKWRVVQEPVALAPHEFPLDLQQKLELEGLEWAEGNLLAEADFGQEDDALFEENSFDELKAKQEQEDEAKQRAKEAEQFAKDGKTVAKKPHQRRTGIISMARKKGDPKLPLVFVLSSGEVTPFLLTLREVSERPALEGTLKAEFSIPLKRGEVGDER